MSTPTAPGGPGYTYPNTLIGQLDANGIYDSWPALQLALAKYSNVYIPPGSYRLSQPLVPLPTGQRIYSDHRQTCTLFTIGNNLFSFPSSQTTESLEISNITLSATGGDIFNAPGGMKRTRVSRCSLIQNSAGFSIMNAPLTNNQTMIECVFDGNNEYVYGATRTVEPWILTGPNNNSQVNQNAWLNEVCFNQNNDASAFPWYHIVATGAGTVNAENGWKNIVLEHPYMGMIRLDGHDGAWIEEVIAWDTTSNIATSLIQILGGLSGAQNSANTTILASGRAGAPNFNASTYDVSLNNCAQTAIINPRGNTQFLINYGNATGVSLINPPAGTIQTNGLAGATAGAAAGTGAPPPVVTGGATPQSFSLTFGSGTGPTAGDMVDITYGVAFTTTPTVIISPYNNASYALNLYVLNPTTTGFSLYAGNAPAATQGNGTYGVRVYVNA